jgi:hypothetical protein
MASEYIPAKRYISPSSFSSRPPARPLAEAEMYFKPVDTLLGPGEVAVGASETVDVDRVKGLVRAVERRQEFEEAGTGAGGGVGVIELVETGGNEGGPTDMGRPPGVRARFKEMPIPPCTESVSTD